MKRGVVLLGLAVLICCFVGCASEPKSRSWSEEEAIETLDFDDLDEDGDGFIDEYEYMDKFPDSDLNIFEKADNNTDGKLDEDEFDWIK